MTVLSVSRTAALALSVSVSDKEDDLNDSFASPKNGIFGSETDSSNEEYLNDSFASPGNKSFCPEHDSEKEEDVSDSCQSQELHLLP